MTVRIEIFSNAIRIIDNDEEISHALKSRLRFEGFSRKFDGNEYILESDGSEGLIRVLDILQKAGVSLHLSTDVQDILHQVKEGKEKLEKSRNLGCLVKEGRIDQLEVDDFLHFLRQDLNRSLLPHQIKAAVHLISVSHGANFSVPGAGKTSVVLSVYEFLRRKNITNALYVVGPRSCFAPWQTEFEITLGRRPSVMILAGGDKDERRQGYYLQKESRAELYLTTYQTLTNDRGHVRNFINDRYNQVFFVIDEAHYMKQDEGVWAGAVAETSNRACKRCVLTGTPFPKNYADGINLFEVLYPNSEVFDRGEKSRIKYASHTGNHRSAKERLEPKIDGLYYRVRKEDLKLSEPVFNQPIQMKMNPIERQLYECIERRISELEDETSDLDFDTIFQLQRARQIRRRQAISYAALLLSAIPDYSEDLIGLQEEQLNERIRNYDKYERPAKMEKLMQKLLLLRGQEEKVVIWSNFVGTLHKIHDECSGIDLESEVVYGGTPTEEEGMDEGSREEIIERFKQENSGLDILIANPAACAESISLHKTCSNAIYYDLSYNCAEYLQSLDRIHRVGGSERTVANYWFLQYMDTFEHEILENLKAKAQRMAKVVDRDFPFAMCELSELGIDEDENIGQ